MHDIRLIDIVHIAEDSLPRDRSSLDPTALSELIASIRGSGLRLPVELYRLPEHHPTKVYGLLSGFRRLAAFRALNAECPTDAQWRSIPASVRHGASRSELLRLMVEENDARADITPWDQARVCVALVPAEFATVDAAVAALYPAIQRQRRARIRAICAVVEAFGPRLVTPEQLSMRQLERLAAACRGGFQALIETALAETRCDSAAAQWKLLENVLREAEAEARAPSAADPRPGRPRRQLRLPSGLVLRREMTRDGWCLRFTGKEATGELVEEVMDWVEGRVGLRVGEGHTD